MKRKLAGIAGALVLAMVGTGLLVGYVQEAKAQAVSGERMVDVLVVTDGVKRGTEATAMSGSVKTVQVPAKVLAAGAVTDLASLKGQVASAELVAGEQVVAARFVSASSVQRADAPKDKLQVTVALAPERAVGGHVRPGDTVAVLLSFDPFAAEGQDGNETPNSTRMILHKVLVVAVQVDAQTSAQIRKDKDDDEAPAPAPAGKLLVTLALDAPSVERVVFGAEHGKVWLSVEPAEAPEAGTKTVTRKNVL